MPSRVWALSAGGVAIIGAAVAGGYFVGHMRTSPTQPVQTTQAAPEPPAQPYPQENQQASANEEQTQSNYPPGYSRSAYSPWKNGSYQRSAARHRSGRVSFQYFRDSLSPHGHWMHSDRWGEVWQPTEVGADFHPYEQGHWTDTQEFGWTWTSDYEWGAIPFHYGRWVDDPERGWVWVPGYVWGPGWVVWRTGSHHTGWMPMPPDQHFLRGEENERVDWSRERDDYGYRDWYGTDYDQQRLDSHWIYVDTGHFADPDYRRYEIRQPTEIHQLNIQTHDATNYVTVDNFIVNRSVDPRIVEQQSGRRIEVVPAARVIAKPELVASVNTGTQIAVTTHQDIPAGTGKPHSAPPTNPVALNAPPPPANAPLPPLPANAAKSVLATQGPTTAPTRPAEQQPSAPANVNAPNAAPTAPNAAPTKPNFAPNAIPPQQQAQQTGGANNASLAEHRHRGAVPAQPEQHQAQVNTTNAPNNTPAATANTQSASPQAQQQTSAPMEERATKHHHGAPAWAQQQGQPQPAPPNPPSATAAMQPPSAQEQAQQAGPSNAAREGRRHHGATEQGVPPQTGENVQSKGSTSTTAAQATVPSQQAEQSQPTGSEGANGGEDRFTRHHGRKQAEQGTEANVPPSQGGGQNGGTPQPSASGGFAQQPSPSLEQQAKHHEKKGEVVPSSLPPGSPSPFAQPQSAQPNANGEAQPDKSNGESKPKKHREKNQNPDTGEPPQQQ